MNASPKLPRLLCRVIAGAACLLLIAAPTRALADGEPKLKVIGPDQRVSENPDELMRSTTQPAAVHPEAATQPAGIPDSVKVSPEARTELESMRDAYRKLASLDMAGSITGRFDVGGEKRDPSADFTASFQAPNKFVYQRNKTMFVGSTGEVVYAYASDRGIYTQKDLPKGKPSFKEIPDPTGSIVAQENPSLMLALSGDAAAQLVANATEVRKLDDARLGDKSYVALEMSTKTGPCKVLLDPDTHLLRQVVMDQRKFLEDAGQSDVAAAQTTWDYKTTVPNAPVKENQFAWSPPADAQDASAANTGPSEGEVQDAAKKLEGKPAPDFKLKGLDGKEVALADQKGSVVVLDFFATWCVPCGQEAPHLEKVYQDNKAAGVKVFGIDEDDDKATVAPYLQEKKLTFPVLLDDADSDIQGKYGVSGIPQTVVIGKDGVIKKVLVGFGDSTEEQLRQAIQAALNEKAKPEKK